MVGAIAHNFHEGSRSEILADYLFSSWGPVTPVRRQDDFGLDPLTERVGKQSWVKEYFTVQVKSTEAPWKFNTPESVKWLIEYPMPLFLCTASKEYQRVRVYHVFPRFLVWAREAGTLPDRLELSPGGDRSANFAAWETGRSVSYPSGPRSSR